MQRMAIVERGDWRTQAARDGFDFHTIDGKPYWCEDAYYAFTLTQIERDIEDPTQELHQLVMGLMDEAVASEELLTRLNIPPGYWDWVANSWRRRDAHLYGRMDLGYTGTGTAKLYELNYDTPTSLFEAGYFQWVWLEDQIAAGRLPAQADQFNRIQEALTERFTLLRDTGALNAVMHFAADEDSIEDQATTRYLQDCAAQAGFETHGLALSDIGITEDGEFTALDDRIIHALFKLYPLEDLLRDAFAPKLKTSHLQLLEPAWKLLLSNKAILALLWQRHPGHPNLLETHWVEAGTQPQPGWVVKPIHSREGANIRMTLETGEHIATQGPYTTGGAIAQRLHALPEFERRWPVIGSWVVGDEAVGIGIREDDTPITSDTARFLPHAIIGLIRAKA